VVPTFRKSRKVGQPIFVALQRWASPRRWTVGVPARHRYALDPTAHLCGVRRWLYQCVDPQQHLQHWLEPPNGSRRASSTRTPERPPPSAIPAQPWPDGSAAACKTQTISTVRPATTTTTEFYNEFTSTNHPPVYNVYSVDNCFGPEGAPQGSVPALSKPNNVPPIIAAGDQSIEQDMAGGPGSSVPAQCFHGKHGQ
jgi:hypothetical protein